MTYPGSFPDHQQSIAVAPGGTIYISVQGAILRFGSDGDYLDRWSVDLGRGATAGLAVGDGGDVYVSDFTHDKILRFSSAGTFEKEWGSTGTGDGARDEQPERAVAVPRGPLGPALAAVGVGLLSGPPPAEGASLAG